MASCWREDTTLRPTFAAICECLQHLLGSASPLPTLIRKGEPQQQNAYQYDTAPEDDQATAMDVDPTYTSSWGRSTAYVEFVHAEHPIVEYLDIGGPSGSPTFTRGKSDGALLERPRAQHARSPVPLPRSDDQDAMLYLEPQISPAPAFGANAQASTAAKLASQQNPLYQPSRPTSLACLHLD